MASNYFLKDLKAVLQGLESVVGATAKYQQQQCLFKWEVSSVKSALENSKSSLLDSVKNLNSEDVVKNAKETFERSSMVYYGIREFAKSASFPETQPLVLDENLPKTTPKGITPEDLQVSELGVADKELIQRLEKEYEIKLESERQRKLNKEKLSDSMVKQPDSSSTVKTDGIETVKKEKENSDGIRPTTKKYIVKQTLNTEARQRKVPSSRIGRMLSFGGLAAGLGAGAVAEATRRTLGFGKEDASRDGTLDGLLLSEANAERIVTTLCKVRGAALKIGQILSIQDNNIISPGLQKAFERVRQSADFMPTWQVNKMLTSQLGPDWRSKMAKFEEKPFAAASIGQVHLITLHDGREAAMKIQYPGVAEGIDSDINNLVGILKIWNVFPKGMFIDNLVEVAKKELSWEVDYEREKECTKRFRELLAQYPQFIVPEVIDELSSKYVFTTILIDGIPIDQCVDLDEKSRNHAARLIMELCLRELFQFRYMQTDPNWSNFFYNPDTQKLALLDFGATRSYTKEFMDQYIEVIKGAADRDRDKVLKISQEMGFLTGYESKAMEAAHVDTVMILGEVFDSSEPFDFGKQDTTLRVTKLVPTIIAERLCPPPEEIYSLHRKLSGVFLLCAKLKVKMSCRKLFLDVYEEYKKNSIKT